VLNYDRRGRGDSGDTPPYSIDLEYEDLAAVLDAAGGSAALVGYSGTGNIALEAAARGLPVGKLALWEPPSVVGDSRPPVPRNRDGGSMSWSGPASPATRWSTG
jgi:pimeloyl-ACP methyl ester carboxylesterase